MRSSTSRSSTSLALFFGLLLALCAVAAIAVVMPASARGQQATVVGAVHPAGTLPPSNSHGLPGIAPRTPSRSGSTPAFTADDARSYALQAKVPGVKVLGTVSVAEVKFMTAGQASALLNGEDIGIPDSSLVCVVVLQGGFDFAARAGQVIHYDGAVEVYDGQTGNLLLMGGR